jgi:hypothetical protein
MIHEQSLVFDRIEVDVVPDVVETEPVSPIFVGALGGLALQQQRGVEPRRDHNLGENAFDSSV